MARDVLRTQHMDLAAFLIDWHKPDACPCRKRHHVAPKPQAPDAPPNTGKQARHLREAIEALETAQENGDENAFLCAQREVDTRVRGLEEYRVAYDSYSTAMHAWASDVCGDCGMSLMVAVPSLGCARCLSADAVEILLLVSP